MEKNISADEVEGRGRLQALAREHRKSLAELSRAIGRNPAYLQQFVMRGSPRRLEPGDVRTIADYLGIAIHALSGLAADEPENHARKGYWRDIPRLALDASAGPGALGAAEIAYDSIRFSQRWLREMGLDAADLSAIRVEGDSMEPDLKRGDEIIVDRRRRTGEGIFVVRVGDALHVKQVRLGSAGRVVLVSANPAYPPLDLAREEVDVIGRVVWKGGRI